MIQGVHWTSELLYLSLGRVQDRRSDAALPLSKDARAHTMLPPSIPLALYDTYMFVSETLYTVMLVNLNTSCTNMHLLVGRREEAGHSGRSGRTT